LGANEAPPAIISIFLGDQLTDILSQIEAGGATKSKMGGVMDLGASTLPSLPKDTTDRNRTSPFAFTGNKFEFRMVGSMQSIAGANFVLNTIVAESLCQFADRLEKAGNVKKEINLIILETIQKHKRVIFNGNNYSEEWVAEANKRGLPNIQNTVDAIAMIRKEKNLAVMEKHGVLSRVEMESRSEINYENYIKTVNIEALTMIEMSQRQILPAVMGYKADLASSISSVQAIDGNTDVEKVLFDKLSSTMKSFYANLAKLEKNVKTAAALHGDTKAQAVAYRDLVFKVMSSLRTDVDTLETMVSAEYWPMPTYAKLLFSI
jgi:glutamine synthetase